MKKTLLILAVLLNLSFNYSQTTYVPDDNFENYLETHDANGNTVAIGATNSMGNGIANDDYVTTANINTVTYLNVNSKNIADLTGIEYFVALERLLCYNNQLTNLNVTQNTALTRLYCYTNQLTSLDVTQNTALTHLSCIINQLTHLDVTQNIALIDLWISNNQLTNLDVTQNTALKALLCNSSQLTSLDVSQNTALITLWCHNNQLTNLDVTQNTALTVLKCEANLPLTRINVKNGNNTNFTYFNVTSNPNLTCIEVDDVAYSNANWTQIDPASNFSSNCHFNETYVPDDAFENHLETHDANGNTVAVGAANSMGNGIANDDYVTTVNISTVTNLDVNSKNIADLTGIEDFAALTHLLCFGNQLIHLDVSTNTSLQLLDCHTNQLTNLDVTQNIALITLNSASNQIINLNMTQNSVLTGLWCHNNQLINLNVKNGNNTNFIDFATTNNPNLVCIEVDDAAYSTANWTNIDTTSSFSQNCVTYVPDDNFENYLETHSANGNVVAVGAANSMGNGIANDDYVTTANINTVTHLNVISKNIADLTGIEDFVTLTHLYCYDNQLTNLNVTQNTALTHLYCYDNQLTNLNVTQNTGLTNFTCSRNPLTNLDVTQNTALIVFGCSGTPLSSLDVTQNTALLELWCIDNQLTSLDVSQNTALTKLWCPISNQLISLDVSQNTALIELNCSNSQLLNLNVKNGNNTNFNTFAASNNPNLPCIEVDDAVYSTANWTNIDATSSFSQNCAISGLTYVPDDAFENHLETHDANGNVVAVGATNSMGNGIANDDYVTTANVNTVIYLYMPSLGITDLTGIEDFVALKNLQIPSNALTTLDVSQNTNLELFYCSVNQLTSLDVSANTSLLYLNCFSNQLTNLDVSNNLALLDLSCGTNQITSLDISLNTNINRLIVANGQLTNLNVKNGNNTNFTLFNALNNPNLNCIVVDDVAYSTANWTNKDAVATFVDDSATCATLTTSDFTLNPFKIYPNPTKGNLIVTSETSGSLTIIDVNGRLIQSAQLKVGENNISLANYPLGMYFFKIETHNGLVIKKMIKQ